MTSNWGRKSGVSSRVRYRRAIFASSLLLVGLLNGACIGGGSLPSCLGAGVSSDGPDGTVFIQQAYVGADVPWGISAKDPAFADGRANWDVDVLVGNQRVQHKGQDYAPHDYVPAQFIVSGEVFKVIGQVTSTSGQAVVGFIDGECVLG